MLGGPKNQRPCFLDTNVLLYSLDARSQAKREIAVRWMDHLWRTETGRTSWQVLNEFYINAIRKIGLPAEDARRVVALVSKWRPGGVSLELIERAWHWVDEAQVSYWDAMVLASAERQGCAVLLSEDFQAGRSYGGVRVINPFADAAREELSQASGTRLH